MKTYTLALSFFICGLLMAKQSHAGGLEEGFESVNDLPNQNWTFENRSDFVGDLFWSQGISKLFAAHDGSANSYILGGVGQTAGNVLCDWLILPDMGAVEQLNFYTRTQPNSLSADRLVVVYSPSGGTTTGPCVNNQPANIAGSSDFGDFQVIHSINPNLDPGGYPEQWTEINVPVNGSGRLALVYFVENVGQSPFNGNLIAIDSLTTGSGTPGVQDATPVPTLSKFSLILLVCLFLLASPLYHRFKQR
ncbi:MAG: choice-of-anchor J domain-containing protein [Marinicella sp.]